MAMSVAALAVAHHNSAPLFDFSKSITVEGTVIEFQFINPHARIRLAAGPPSGEELAWQQMEYAMLDLRVYHKSHNALPAGDTEAIVRALNEEILPVMRWRKMDGGVWLDPWGHPYRIFISGQSVLIRCAGPNGVFDDGNDEKRDDILLESTVE